MNKLIWLIIVFGALLSGCLHTYHDYAFEPDTYYSPGLILWVHARLYDSDGRVDGTLADSTGLYWQIWANLGLDDSLKGPSYVIIDSLQITVPGRADTVECNLPRRLYFPGHMSMSWPCDRIPFSELHADSVELSMLVWSVLGDGQSRQRHEVSWTGRLKKTRVHSDY